MAETLSIDPQELDNSTDNAQQTQNAQIISPIHKRPKDSAPSKVDTKEESGARKDAPVTNAEAKEADESKEQKETETYPVSVYVRIRPLVGREVEEGHQTIGYAVKKLKKNQRFKLTVKPTKVDDDEDNEKNDATDDADADATKFKMKRFQRRSRDPDAFKGLKRVMLPEHDNAATYAACVAPSLDDMFNQVAVCAFAYGHTGSGKTHTIFGYDAEEGMYRLFARDLCQRIDAFNAQRAADVPKALLEVRFLELYQQKIRDLLDDEGTELALREDAKGRVHFRGAMEKMDQDSPMVMHDVTRKYASDVDSIQTLIAEGMKSRNVGNSTLHDKSSRSHAFLEFEIMSEPLAAARKRLAVIDSELVHTQNQIDLSKLRKAKAKTGKLLKQISKLKEEEKALKKSVKNQKAPFGGTFVFVDLAGNEYGRDVGRGRADKEQEKERNEINKSLFALKECIRGINNRKKRVPYRESKLTMYLRRFLAGEKCRAIMMTNIGPSAQLIRQTLNTLKYAELVAKSGSK